MQAGYPSNLSYIVKRLSGYSKATFKLQSLNQSTASAGQIVTVDLPNNSLIDLSTLTWFFKGTTTTSAGYAVFPRGIESIIERLEVEVNGQLVGSGCSYYNQLWNIIDSTSFGEDVQNRRKVLQNGADIAAAPGANVTGQQYAIQNWLGFLGSCKPNILDSALLGNVRIRITLAGTQILAKSATGAGESYSLSDMFFSVDCIDISDGVFHELHNRFLQSGGVYEMPFKNYMSFSSTGSLGQTCKFSLSTQSLDRVWGMFTTGGNYIVGGDATSGFFDTNSATSGYFSRIGNAGTITYGDDTNNQPVTYALANYQFNVNGTYFPNFKPSAEQAYALMLNSYNLSQDTLGGGSKNCDSINKWNKGYWVACQEFEHGDGYISGLDTRGNVASCYLETNGSITLGTKKGTGAANPGTNIVCLVFAECTSLLRVAAGKQIELVL